MMATDRDTNRIGPSPYQGEVGWGYPFVHLKPSLIHLLRCAAESDSIKVPAKLDSPRISGIG